jgi:hypothetical protein
MANIPLSSDGTIVIPAMTSIILIKINNIAAFSVTGGINIGTTPGGADILSNYPVNASSFDTLNGASLLVQSYQLQTTLYISAVTSWNSANLTMEYIIR